MYVLELAGQDDQFAVAEAATAVTAARPIAPGVAVADAIDPDRVRHLAFTRRASAVVGRTDASVAAARDLLASVALDRSGSVAVRARDVRGTTGVDTQRAERELGSVLVDRGFSVDLEAPTHTLVALFAADVGVLGWVDVESARDYGARAPTEKPFFQPGSMGPLEARALANLAGARPGRTVLDPMCGTGGLLVEAGLVGARVVGLDVQARMVRGARRNLAHYLDTPFDVLRGDVAHLPIRADGVDAAVFDTPYGRQSPIEGRDRDTIVDGALAAVHDVTDRAVVVCDRALDSAADAAGWSVEDRFERRVHRSLVRHVHVLGRR